VPAGDSDQHGNPVVRREDELFAPKTGWPYEVWLDDPRMELVLVPAGEFMMGSPDGEKGRSSGEGPVHKVRISRPFYLAKYQVTNGQYRAFKPEHDSGSYENNHSLNEDRQPVVRVSHSDAPAFCEWLGERAAAEVRLPTEAEWEYACRAGTGGRFFWGESESDAGEYANVADRTARKEWPDWPVFDTDDGYAVGSPVGRFKPNPFGLYDMLGNVWEWCLDGRRKYASSEETDPRGPSGGFCVLRGGSWYDNPSYVRCADRYDRDLPVDTNDLGFRVLFCVPSAQ